MTLSYPPRRLESDAERMIDSLFSDLDQALDKNDNLNLSPSTADNNSPQPETDIARASLAEGWDDDDPEKSIFRDHPLYDVDFEPFLEEEREPFPHQQKSSVWARHFDKILFFSACSLFMGSLFLIADHHQFSLANWEAIQMAMADAEPETPPLSDPNLEFLHYMERALVEIDQEQALAEQVKAEPITEQPQPPVTPITPQAQPKPTLASQPQASSSISALPALPPPPPPIQQNPKPASSPPPDNSTPQPASTQEVEKQTVPPTQPSAPKPDSSPTAVSQPDPIETSPQKSSHTLVGLLELGEHSAALLKFEGSTQRIMLEETIPGSNWKLVSVVNQKATFTNNEQQKVIFVGEAMSVQ